MALWSHTLSSLSGGGGVNNHLSRVKIHVQTWGLIFEIMGRYCITFCLCSRVVLLTLRNFIARPGIGGVIV